MRRILLIVVLGLITFNFVTIAQETNKAGTSAAQFLKIGVGAREISMAGATAGLVNDESSMYWNPAGLVGVKKLSVYASHTNWFADLKHNFFGFVIPVGYDQAIGINATVLSMGDMEITNELSPTGTGEFFEASDISIGLSYSIQLVDFFSFGATVKYITQNIYNETASTAAIDLGTKLNTGYEGIKIGMSFTNFGGKLKLEGRDLQKTYDPIPNNATNVGVKSDLRTEEWELPTNFRVGIGWDIINSYDAMYLSNEHKLLLAVDANHPIDAPENLSVGMDYTWRKLISFRSGYHFNDDIRTWAVGMGINYEIPNSLSVSVDYAYQELERLGDIHSFTVKISL
ncbi:MAG: PorV/PorQ family protein [Bacteroidetes bacterium]|nr:PorV/PorQ family protein [Bacteroidota bacterium]